MTTNNDDSMKVVTYDEGTLKPLEIANKKAIAAAKAELHIGQHWRIKEPSDKLPIYPTDILILELSDFSMGGVVTLCLAPYKMKGKHFPARADVIINYYSLVYDPFKGYVWPFKEEEK